MDIITAESLQERGVNVDMIHASARRAASHVKYGGAIHVGFGPGDATAYRLTITPVHSLSVVRDFVNARPWGFGDEAVVAFSITGRAAVWSVNYAGEDFAAHLVDPAEAHTLAVLTEFFRSFRSEFTGEQV